MRDAAVGGDICALIVGMIMHVAMVAVGASYTDGMEPESDCKLQAVYYLKVAGGILITLDILTIIFFGIRFIGIRFDGLIYGPICGMVNLVGSVVIFCWGSDIVFGHYQDWTYDEADRESNSYCSYAPYMFFIFSLILGWCFTAIRMILCCLFGCPTIYI